MEQITTTHPNTKLTRAIFGMSAGLGLLIAFVFDWHHPGVQVFATAAIMSAIILGASHLAGKKITGWAIGLLTVAVLLAGFVPLRDASGVIGLNIFFSLIFIVFAIWEIIKPDRLKVTDYLLGPMLLPLFSMEYFPRGLRGLSISRRKRTLSEEQRKMLRGVAVSVPLLVIFGSMLASADAIFADILGGIFNIELDLGGDWFWRTALFIGVLTTSSSALLYALIFSSPEDNSSPQKKIKDYGTELTVILSSLAGLFGFFIMIQIVYLFGGREVVLDGGLTFAEYARSGFFELLGVSFMAFWLAFFVKRALASTTKTAPKILILTIIAEVGLIILSASKRLSLYEEMFGFTYDRFLSHSFVFFLAAGFGILAYTIVRHKPEERLMQLLVLGFGSYLVIFNLINPHAFIAQQNLDRFRETGKIDGFHIAGLSEDALDTRIVVYDELQKSDDVQRIEAANAIGRSLCRSQESFSREQHWSSVNLARRNAKTRIEQLNLDCEQLNSIEHGPYHNHAPYPVR